MSNMDEIYYINIRNTLLFREGTVRIDANGNLLSLAVISEGFYCALLNTLKGWNLINANSEEKNAPGIDLIDKNQKIAVQVSLTCDHEKVQCSIDKFKAESYDGWHFYFVPIKRDTTCFRKYFTLPEGMIFHKDEDVLSISRILGIVQQELDIDKKRKLSNLMDKYTKELATHEALCKRLYDRLCKARDDHPSFRLMGEDGIDKQLFPHTNELIPVLGNTDGNVAPIWEHIKAEQKENFRHIIIEGDGGIGKSVSLLSVTEDKSLLTQIPAIYIHMYDLVYGGKCLTLPEFLAHNADHDEIDRLCSEGGEPKLMLLLDGLNELPYEHQSEILRSVQQWAAGHRGAQLIITSRPIPGKKLESILGKDASHIKLTGLEKEQCKERLTAWNIPLPNDGAKIWETLKLPLFLTLYAKTARLPKKTLEDYPLDVREVTGPASLIWNYLQRELLREEKAEWPVCCAIACEFIAPYIAYQMAIKNTFVLGRKEAEQLVKEVVKQIDMEVLPTHLKNVNENRQFDSDRLPEKDWVKFVLAQSGIFVASKGGTKEEKPDDNGESEASGDGYAFMHQNFRDYLASMYLVNQAETAQKDGFPEIWGQSLNHWELDYAAELMTSDLYGKLWESNRAMQQYDRQEYYKNNTATFNLLEMWKRNVNLTENLDFSGMDLRGFSLTRYLQSYGQALPLFRDRSLTKKTKLDRSTFGSEGHFKCINALTILPNGHVVSASKDYTLRVWDTATGQCLRTLRGHNEPVTCVVSLPDGRIVSGSEDTTLRIWNPSTGESSQPLCGHTSDVVCVAYLSDNRVISGSADNTLRIWDLKKECCIRVLNNYNGHTKNDHRLIVLPDDKVVSDSVDNTIRIWDTNNDTIIPISEKSSHAVICLSALSNDLIISGSSDGVLRVWDIRLKKCVHTLVGHTAPVSCISILPNNSIVSAGYDHTIRIWNIDSEECIYILDLNACTAIHQLIALSNRMIVFHCANSILGMWDPSTDSCFKTMELDYADTYCILPLPNGTVVFGTILGSLMLWDPTQKKQLMHMGRFSQKSYYTTCFPDGKIFTALQDGTLRIWDMTEGRCVQSIKGFDKTITCAVALPDGRVAISSIKKEICFWDLKTGQCCNFLKEHTENVTCLAVCQNGSLVSGSEDGSLRIWDTKNGLCSHILRGHVGGIRNVGCLPDGRIISNAKDSTMRIWDAETKKCIQTIVGPPTVSGSFVITDEGCVVGLGSDRQIHIWDMSSYKHIKCLHSNCLNNSIPFISILPDGRVITGHFDNSIWVWNANTEKWDINQVLYPGTLSGRLTRKKRVSASATVWYLGADTITFASACLDSLIIAVSNNPDILVIDSATNKCMSTIGIMEIDPSEMDFSEAELDWTTMRLLFQNGARIPEDSEKKLRNQHKQILAKAYKNYGENILKNGQAEEAIGYINKAYTIFSDAGSQIDCANALYSCGIALVQTGDTDGAKSALKKAEEIFRVEENMLGIANVLTIQGNLFIQTNQVLSAINAFSRAETIYKKDQNDQGIASVLFNRGLLFDNIGDFEAAKKCYEESLQYYRKVQEPVGLCLTLSYLYNCLLELGEEALEQYKNEALSILPRLPENIQALVKQMFGYDD